MYQNHKKAQRFKKLKKIIPKERRTVCLICFKTIGSRLSFRSLALNTMICEACLCQFERSCFEKTVNGIKIAALYRRNDFIEGLYQRYAIMYDYALKDAFIMPLKKELMRYRTYQIVTLEDDEKINAKRLYDADLSIAQSFGENCFVIHGDQITSGDRLRNANVLFFTGRCLSSEEMDAAFKIIQSYHPHLIEGLLLAY